ncbi:MAG TPA: hypothetical protein VF529_05715 [Solirubrobacteraceae bacterium]|jgi:hypothetical protein
MLALLADGTFYVSPSAGLIAWTVAPLVLLVAAVVIALRDRRR